MPVYEKKPNLVNITGDLHQINFSIDDFKRIREENYLYVDKSKLIEDILTYDKGMALLFTRPRRFGKSLNLSMLRYFFDMTEDSKDLFKGLYIEQSDFFKTHLNQYPVLYLNFKGVSSRCLEDIQEKIIFIFEKLLKDLYEQYQFEALKEISIKTKTGNVDSLGIKEITEVLYKNTQKKVVVLIDEYDSLFNRTYGTEYWHDVAGITKEIFGELIKSNEYLEMGVLTGVSKIGKELGFSDMNNLSVCGLTKERYYDYFGLTETEVKELLYQNNIEITNDFYKMYNGYYIGKTSHVFNTASILKFLDDFYDTGEVILSPYWINSSVNVILKDNISKQDTSFKNQLLTLLDGKTLTESIYESIDYELLDKPAYMFSLLIDTGYLCPIKKVGGNLFEIKIPNEEILYGYQDMIDRIVGTNGKILDNLCTCLIEGRVESFEEQFNQILMSVASFHDFSERENSYHNLMMGALLYVLGKFKVNSNRESGLGRYDIAMLPTEYFKKKYRPIIIEFKVAKERIKDKEYSEEELLALAEEALLQIENKQYFDEYADIYGRDDFFKIGVGAQGKRCKVMGAALRRLDLGDSQ